jgi:hypothetical protein
MRTGEGAEKKLLDKWVKATSGRVEFPEAVWEGFLWIS